VGILKLMSIEIVNRCIVVKLEGNSGLHHTKLDMRNGKVMCSCIGFRNSKRIPLYCHHCGLIHFLLKRVFRWS